MLLAWVAPFLAFVLLVTQLPDIKKGITRKNLTYIIIGLAIMFCAIFSNLSTSSNERDLTNKIETLNITASNQRDSMQIIKDTLINIGLSIDEKTGRLLVMDSQLLKKEFIQILNISYNDKPEGIPDSENVQVFKRNDTLFLFPKQGTWAHGYIAHDTLNSKEFEADFFEGIVPYPGENFRINGKVYSTQLLKIHERAVYRTNPIKISMRRYKGRYIIFGDEGVPSKRWIYQSGKVTWIPEE